MYIVATNLKPKLNSEKHTCKGIMTQEVNKRENATN